MSEELNIQVPLFNEYASLNQYGNWFCEKADEYAQKLVEYADAHALDLRHCQLMAGECMSQRFAEAILVRATKRYKQKSK